MGGGSQGDTLCMITGGTGYDAFGLLFFCQLGDFEAGTADFE